MLLFGHRTLGYNMDKEGLWLNKLFFRMLNDYPLLAVSRFKIAHNVVYVL